VEGGTGTDQPNGSIFGFIIGLATQGSDPAPEFRGLQFRHQVGLTNASAGVHSNNILEMQQTSPAISGAGSNLQTSGNPPGAGSPAGTDKSEIGPQYLRNPHLQRSAFYNVKTSCIRNRKFISFTLCVVRELLHVHRARRPRSHAEERFSVASLPRLLMLGVLEKPAVPTCRMSKLLMSITKREVTSCRSAHVDARQRTPIENYLRVFAVATFRKS
jgi:hypothetical protein